MTGLARWAVTAAVAAQPSCRRVSADASGPRMQASRPALPSRRAAARLTLCRAGPRASPGAGPNDAEDELDVRCLAALHRALTHTHRVSQAPSPAEWAALDREAAAFVAAAYPDDAGLDALEIDGGDHGDEEDEDDEGDEGGGARAGGRGGVTAADEPSNAGLTRAERLTRSQRRRAGNAGLWQAPLAALARVAIVGRPNVGKSALFNRLTDGAGRAIVYDEAGVTRDRRYSRMMWSGREMLAIDTGGLMDMPTAEGAGGGRPAPPPPTPPVGGRGAARAAAVMQRMAAAAAASPAEAGARGDYAGELRGMIERQAAAALAEAHAAVVVVDGQAGPMGGDDALVRWLRRTRPGLPLVLAVNKCESRVAGAAQASQFWGMGLTPHPVSALSGSGTGDLLDDLCAKLPSQEELSNRAAAKKAAAAAAAAAAGGGLDADNTPLAVAILGRPNVGKSSLLNSLAGEERACVSPRAGTTIDAVDAEVTAPGGRRIRVIDTAGIRKRGAVHSGADGAEDAAVRRAFQTLRRADVAALIIDAATGATEQDVRLADRVAASGAACVVVVNKWDTVPDKSGQTMVAYEKSLKVKLREVDWAPTVYTCALTGQRVPKILEAVEAAGTQHRKRVGTALLNQVVRDAVAFKPPPANGERKGRLYYATQAAIRPPTFVFFVNDARLFTEAYRRYIERSLRENIGFPGTPLRLLWRGKAPSTPKTRAEKATSGVPYGG